MYPANRDDRPDEFGEVVPVFVVGASQKVPLAVKLFCARHSSRRLKAARDRRTFATAWPFKQGQVSPA